MERLGILHRQFDAFLELADGIANAADVGPADLGHLDHDFAHGGRLDPLERREEILAPDVELVEHLGRNGPLVEVDLGHDPPHSVDRRFACQRRNVGADETVGRLGQFIEIDLVAQRHAAGMDAEDFAAALLVGHTDHDFAVETARAAQCLVDRVGAIGRCDHHQVRARFEPVHQRQQLRHEALFGFARHAVALGGDRIDFVDEDDRGGGLARLFEHLAQRLLALAIARAHDFGTVDGEEIGVAFIGDRLRQPGLAGPRGAMQQHALGRIDAQAGEQFGIAQRQFDHLAQLLDGILHPADIVVIDYRAGIARGFEFGAQFDLGILVDMDDALGRGRNNAEADLGQRISRGIEHAAHFGRHVLHRLLPGGGDQIARNQRFAEEIALQRLRRALQAHFALRRGEDDARRGARLAYCDLYMLTRTDLGIAALEPVEPHHVEALVLVIGGHGDRRGGALAGYLDDIAFGNTKRLEGRARHARDALPAFILARRCNLQSDGGFLCCC